LGSGTSSVEGSRVAAFTQRLRELSWVENRTVAIEYRWAEGQSERYREIAAEFVRLKVDVIVSSATSSSVAAKQATTAIPIVFVGAADPVGIGLVASLARPGGNVTGVTNQLTDTATRCERSSTIAAELDAPSLGSSKGCLGALGDGSPFVLRDHRHDPHCHAVGIGHVCRYEVHA